MAVYPQMSGPLDRPTVEISNEPSPRSSAELPSDELLLLGDRKARFHEIEKRIREEVRKHPDDLGTLSDIATTGGGGEDLGENFSNRSENPDEPEKEDDRSDAA